MKVAALLIAVGFALIFYANTLSPYVDTERFRSQYGEMKVGDSAKFFKLRAELETPKYRVHDIGLCFLAAGLLALFRRVITATPKSALGYTAAAIGAPAVTTLGYAFDLSQGLERTEFPWWADSLGIPLAAAPVLFLIALGWGCAHLLFLRKITLRSVPVQKAISRKGNWWLLGVSSITSILVLWELSHGAYWYALPGLLWLYFYMSIAAARVAQNEA